MKIFKRPNEAIFEKADEHSAIVDETIFGTEATVLEEVGDFVKIRTFYDYEGYVKKYAVGDGEAGDRVVGALVCDVLPTPEYKYAPKLTLTRGSRVTIDEKNDYDRFFRVFLPDGDEGYIRKSSMNFYYGTSCDEYGNTDFGQRVANTAEEYIGAPYRWGGKSYLGIDCSGLAFMSYYMNGVTIWRDAIPEKSPMLKKTTLEKIKEGDLIFFKGHVAISLGGDKFIHATTFGRGTVSEEYLDVRLKKEDIIGVYTLKE